MASILFDLMFKMIFMLVLGYALRRLNVITITDQQALMNFLIKVAIPFLVIVSSQKALDAGSVSAIIITVVVNLALYFIGLPLLYKLSGHLGLDADERRIFAASAVCANIGFLGYPVIEEIYGDAGLIITAMTVMIFNFAFFSWVFPFIRRSSGFNLRDLTHNATIIVCCISLVIYFTQIKFPETLYNSCLYISNMSFPLSMIIIGCMLADVDIPGILGDKRIYIVSALRLFIVPGVIYGILSILGIDRELTGILTILTSIPTAAMVSIAAADADCAPEYAVKAMLQPIILMLISLPFWTFVLLR